MSVRHAPCGGTVRWKSVLDAELRPALVPWCDRCEEPVETVLLQGRVEDIDVAPEELAEHRQLRAWARTWAGVGPWVH
jgi:hypothetical protein